jgi:ribonuclease P/MRP protein subunit RPP1
MASSSYGDLLLQEQQQQHYYSSPPMMQRVMSAGDLQQAPAHAAAVPAPAARYSAEERRERIEKYRTKRNQRNFQKKITVRSSLASYPVLYRCIARTCVLYILWTDHHASCVQYACRKTLADSRPRVKGRFARNVDDDAAADQPEDATATTSMTEVSNFVNDGSGMPPEWWPAMQGELAIEDEELIASYLAVSSINLY